MEVQRIGTEGWRNLFSLPKVGRIVPSRFREKVQWIVEATFVLLNLLFRSSKNWYRRMEEFILGTEGWNYGSIVICRESPMD